MATNLKIELLNSKGKKETFKEDFVPAIKVIKALDLIEESGGDKALKEIDQNMVDFVVDVFSDEKVTSEAVWNGLNALDFNATLLDIVYKVAGVDPKKMQATETE